MPKQIWFELKYRDKSFNKYTLKIFVGSVADNNFIVTIEVYQNDDYVDNIYLEFARSWAARYCELEKFNEILGNDNHSPLIVNMIRDYIFDKDIKKLNKNFTLSIHSGSEYKNKIFLNDNNILNYKRDPIIIAKENKFAREIVLRISYFIQSSNAVISVKNLIEECNYYNNSIVNAISALSDRKFLKKVKEGFIKVTYDGLNFIEDKLLTPFNDKIFLIAACGNDIYNLIEKVYEPVVKELGYQLIFQERTEPKGSINDDIWEYLVNCKLIMCDLSYQRPNCFIEYGYALANKKHIILCVEESEGKSAEGLMKVPFDTQTQKYSFWKKEWFSDNKFENELNKYKAEIKERILMKLKILDLESEI